jgi:hypothetical protein
LVNSVNFANIAKLIIKFGFDCRRNTHSPVGETITKI